MLKLLTAAVLLGAAFLSAPADAAMYGSSSSGGSSYHSMKPAPAPMMAVPWKRIHTRKGWIWADSRGYALYTYSKDTAGHATCYGQCAIAWPPFYAAMGAQTMGPWTVVHRFGFSQQWAYKGKPLYFFFKDTAPGQVNGDGDNGFSVARP